MEGADLSFLRLSSFQRSHLTDGSCSTGFSEWRRWAERTAIVEPLWWTPVTAPLVLLTHIMPKDYSCGNGGHQRGNVSAKHGHSSTRDTSLWNIIKYLVAEILCSAMSDIGRYFLSSTLHFLIVVSKASLSCIKSSFTVCRHFLSCLFNLFPYSFHSYDVLRQVLNYHL